MRELAETLRVNTLMNVDAEIAVPPRGQLTEAQAVGLFHIAQEALNNVSKHSQATAVSIKLCSQDGQVKLDVTDNGIGFDSEEGRSTGKHGLRNIRDRAKSMGAEMAIESNIRHGTRVHVSLPLGGKEDGSSE
jgi:signal transduction histidine kinase